MNTKCYCGLTIIMLFFPDTMYLGERMILIIYTTYHQIDKTQRKNFKNNIIK